MKEKNEAVEELAIHVGDKVRITDKHIADMVKSSNSPKTPGYPCSSLIKLAQAVAEVGSVGVVTNKYTSLRQITARFGTMSLRLKSHWVETL